MSSAAGRAGGASAEWYSQADAQYEALLHWRDEQQRQIDNVPPPVVVHGAYVIVAGANAAPHSAAADGVARLAAPSAPSAAVDTAQRARPQSSQSNRRRSKGQSSRRTNSELPLQQQQPQRNSPSVLPSNAQRSVQSVSGLSADDCVPAAFQQMIQQQAESKQQAALFKKQKAQERVEQKAEEDGRRVEHRAKMKAIQLRAPATPTISASSSPIATPQSSRPASRLGKPSDAVHAAVRADSLTAPSPSSPVSSLFAQHGTTAPTTAQSQRIPLQSASVTPLSSFAPSVASADKQPTHPHHNSSNHTSPRTRIPTKQPPSVTAAAASSTDSSLSASPSFAAANNSRDSLRSLMRASRRQLQQRQGSDEAVVEVRVGKPYTPRGSVSDGLVRHASCEFDVVFASATTSLAGSPADTRRETADSDTSVNMPQ